MVRVVLGVLDGDVLEYMAVNPQKVVRPGPHLTLFLDYVPHPPIPRLGFGTREELHSHVFQVGGHYGL